MARIEQNHLETRGVEMTPDELRGALETGMARAEIGEDGPLDSVDALSPAQVNMALELREYIRDAFGAFALPGDAPLGELAAFYGLPIPARYSTNTASEMFASRFEGEVHIGDRVRLGAATLVVRKVREGRAAEVGIVFHSDSLGRFQQWLSGWRERLPGRR